MKVYDTAREAIAHSVQHSEMAGCKNTPENHAALRSECSDHCRSDHGDGNSKDYWLDDLSSLNKMTWKVGIVVPGPYLNGYLDGLLRHAWWKDGIQYVGTCGTTLEEAIERAKKELSN